MVVGALIFVLGIDLVKEVSLRDFDLGGVLIRVLAVCLGYPASS